MTGLQTTVRIDREVRERLRRLERQLGVTTPVALARAVDALDQELFWARVEAHYDDAPLADDDAAWIAQVERAQG